MVEGEPRGMTHDEIFRAWKENLAGVLDAAELVEVRRDAEGIYYECPCGGTGHCAWRPALREGHTTVGLSDMLTCFETRRQWFVRTDAADILRGEEQSYLDLLHNAEKVVRRVLPRVRHLGRDELLKFLHETHGIPEDVAGPLLEIRA